MKTHEQAVDKNAKFSEEINQRLSILIHIQPNHFVAKMTRLFFSHSQTTHELLGNNNITYTIGIVCIEFSIHCRCPSNKKYTKMRGNCRVFALFTFVNVNMGLVSYVFNL